MVRDRNRGVRILAKSVYKALNAQGYDSGQIVAFATELLGYLTDDLARGRGVVHCKDEKKVRIRRWPKRLGVRRTPPVHRLQAAPRVGFRSG